MFPKPISDKPSYEGSGYIACSPRGCSFYIKGMLITLAVIAFMVGVLTFITLADRRIALNAQRRAAVQAGKAEWYWDKEGNMHWRLLDADAND